MLKVQQNSKIYLFSLDAYSSFLLHLYLLLGRSLFQTLHLSGLDRGHVLFSHVHPDHG